MSIRIYLDDFQSVLTQLEGLSNDGGVLTQYSNAGAVEAIAKEYTELVTDFTDWLRENSIYGLAGKLEGIKGEDESGYGHPKLGELNARLRRSLRAIRTYTSDSDLISPLEKQISEALYPDPRIALAHPKLSSGPENKVFVVHGHDEAMLHQVMRLLADLGLEGIVLREQISSGKAVIEKLEYYSNVKFAIVFMTADDFGASNKKASQSDYSPRARQNVIMELGFFVGKLKRSNVCVLKEHGVEEPFDILGVVYVPIDSASAWRLTLCKELKAAGFSVDLNLL